MDFGRPPRHPTLSPEQEALLCRLIENNPSLKDLTVGFYITDRDGLLAILTNDRLPRLETLDIFHAYDALRVKAFLEQSPSSLRKLSVACGLRRTDPFGPDGRDEPDLWPCLPHPWLESLFLSGAWALFTPDSEYVTLEFIRNCSSSLRAVRMSRGEHCIIRSINRALVDLGLGPGLRFRSEDFPPELPVDL
jgi:hypothetical protein